MRFIAILNINKFEVGKGYGANKRIAKMTAARMAL
jgi:dsRNA-specific ribonuclease